MKAPKESWWREWIIPMVTLTSIAIAAFLFAYVFDVFVSGGPSSDAPRRAIATYFYFDEDHVTDAVSALGGMVAGVLGIVVSVVSIVVQLSANRYTGVATMFFRDRTNLTVISVYIVACVAGVWVSVSLRDDFVPRATMLAMMLTVTLCLVMMGPYFAYVFRFLEPTNIILRIQDRALATAEAGSKSGEERERADSQAQVLSAMEELTDISSNSIGGKDKIIASRAVDAIKDFTLRYIELKPAATESWFEVGESIRDNPDFVAMDSESLSELEVRRTWVEWKAMRQYLGIYNEALGSMRDINYLIAIDTRYIGEAAATVKDQTLMVLVLRYMNSYLRTTLNAKDVRTAYNVMNQYRLLVEAFLRRDCSDVALMATRHMRYYALVAYDMHLPFVTETVAYDVSTLCQVAAELELPVESDLIAELLLMDRPSPERAQEQALKGVRKAQVKLAAYYLHAGQDEKARRIKHDMAQEPRQRLDAIRNELVAVDTKDFWEIIDRGRNFEFMPEAQRDELKRFFAWFDEA